MKTQFINPAIRTGALVMVTIFIMTCGNNATHEEKNPTKGHSETQASSMSQTADLIFQDQKGKTVSLSSLKGKVVFINFWATWCPPCIQEMPSINKLKQSFNGNDHIVFLMVDVDANIKKSTGFMEKNQYDLPVYVPASEIPPSFLGDAIPTTVILDKKGNLIARMEGGRDYADPQMVTALNALIKSDE